VTPRPCFASVLARRSCCYPQSLLGQLVTRPTLSLLSMFFIHELCHNYGGEEEELLSVLARAASRQAYPKSPLTVLYP